MKKLIFLLIFLCGCNNSLPFVLTKEGEVDRVEYLQATFTESPQTIIYFKDGGTKVLPIFLSIPSKEIQVWEKPECLMQDMPCYKITESDHKSL